MSAEAILKPLMKPGRYEAATTVARSLLDDNSDMSLAEQAVVYGYLCRARRHLKQHMGALEAGYVARELAGKVGNQALRAEHGIDVALCLRRIERYEDAARVWHEVLTDAPADWLTAKRRASAEYNLGVIRRCQTQYDVALEHFRTALDMARGVDEQLLLFARDSLTHELLRAKRVEEAQRAMAETDAYLAAHPDDEETRAGYEIDQAELLWLQGQKDDAWDAIRHAAGFARASHEVKCYKWLALAQFALERRMPERVIAAGILAKAAAEQAERPDLLGESLALLRDGELQDPDAPERLFKQLPVPGFYA